MINWFATDVETIAGILTSIICIYIALILFVKINGLRSFSKMSAYDFASTVAIGSIIASTVIAKDPSIISGAVAIGGLLFLQSFISKFRILTNKSYLDNEPLLLMDGNKILDENLKIAKVTHNDLIAKLREANVLNFDEVHAVVFEATGDVSVLHGKGNFSSEKLLQDVKRQK